MKTLNQYKVDSFEFIKMLNKKIGKGKFVNKVVGVRLEEGSILFDLEIINFNK